MSHVPYALSDSAAKIMSVLWLIRFEDSKAFLQALKQYDDSFMNYCLGSLLDAVSQNRVDSNMMTLLSVYRGNELLIVLTKSPKDVSWIMSVPQSVEGTLDAQELAASAKLLSSAVFAVADPSSMDKVIGPRDAVNAFLEGWIALMEAKGVHLQLIDPWFVLRVSYANARTLPPPSSAFSKYTIIQASITDDVESLIPLYLDLLSHGPNSGTEETARALFKSSIEARLTWICRVDGVLAGYVLLGRVTPRTIAIRNVYVSPDRRRKGIAEAMVRAVTRYYLGVQPLAFESAPSTPPEVGIKEEVCLNVADAGAERVYTRCGFLFHSPTDEESVAGRDKKGWYTSIWQGVQPVQ
ncbi:hypothetical protein A0H81_14359 [Grifola frondosa]|uniref:N-acetyltransferase domain-containing protein n=1 Tax=Grifola frondosa TaxID=5627 RepID=A0A1C7LM24_GRIFR|nr:hypothetical protein A0H81_14359 [Grifola frondosa]